MAEGTEQDSLPSSAQHGTGKTTGTGVEGQAVPDLKQEPGDDNEGRADASSGRCTAEGRCLNTSPRPGEDDQTPASGGEPDSLDAGAGGKLDEPERSPVQGSLASGTDFAQEGSRVLKQEQRVGGNVSSSPPADPTKTAEKAEHGGKRPASLELTSSDGEPLSRMDSEDSISSTLMDMDSTASSGRSTPAMLNGGGGTAVGGSAAAGGKPLSYTCCWDHCQLLFSSSPDLAEHIRATHVDGQRGGVSVCLSVERLQGVQHAVHQPELAAEAHAEPQRGQALQVRGGGLQRHLRLAGGAGPPRPHPLQLPGFVQGVQPGQSEGGVSVQGRPQQEEEAPEQVPPLAAPASRLLRRPDHGRHPPPSHLPQPGHAHRKPGQRAQRGVSQPGNSQEERGLRESEGPAALDTRRHTTGCVGERGRPAAAEDQSGSPVPAAHRHGCPPGPQHLQDVLLISSW